MIISKHKINGLSQLNHFKPSTGVHKRLYIAYVYFVIGFQLRLAALAIPFFYSIISHYCNLLLFLLLILTDFRRSSPPALSGVLVRSSGVAVVALQVLLQQQTTAGRGLVVTLTASQLHSSSTARPLYNSQPT